MTGGGQKPWDRRWGCEDGKPELYKGERERDVDSDLGGQQLLAEHDDR